jgi:hypothetical protein
MEPKTLLTLPLEIQTKIFQYLTTSFGKSSIQAVLRTCQQLYKAALPVSVSVFRNTAPYPEDYGLCSRARNIKFLRYILISKPWLAKHVQTVIIGRFSQAGHSDNLGQDQGLISDQELGIFEHHIKYILGQLPYNDEWSAQWTYDLTIGSSDAEVSLILLTCPNIRTLLFEMPKEAHHFPLLLNFTRIMSNTSYYFGPDWSNRKYAEKIVPLANLQDVFHETLHPSGYHTFHNEAPNLFGFPKLRLYECIGTQGTLQEARRFADLPPRSSSVEEIILHWTWSTANLLKNMLDSCRGLKQFEFSSHREFNATSDAAIMPRDILDAILPHASTLENLYLNLDDFQDKQVDNPQRLHMGTDLRQMHSLKRLTIGMQELLGIHASALFNYNEGTGQLPPSSPALLDCLPENLEYLLIHSCGGGIIIDQVHSLLHAITQSGRFNKLTYFGILFNGWREDVPNTVGYMDGHPDFDNDMVAVDEYKSLEFDLGFQTYTAYHLPSSTIDRAI